MSEQQLVEKSEDIKSRVMGEIRKKKICMAGHGEILAKKLGLECAIVASLLAGAFVFSLIFYVLKKTKILKFLLMGSPGLKVFFLSVPYGYLVAFIGAVILALYFSNKLDLSYQTKISSNLIKLILLFATVVLVVIFILADAHRLFGEPANMRIPKEMAIDGKIMEFSPEKIIVEEEDGRVVELKPEKKIGSDLKAEEILGKHLQAVGVRDPKDDHFFDAQEILCCDND